MTFEKESTLDWETYIGLGNGIIFTTMTGNRKRSREDDTSCEFMPLSKRINNLHINNNLTTANVPAGQESSPINVIVMENGISSSSSSSDSERPSYDPGINSSQSSYYYENKLLFELHLERLQRSGQPYAF